MRFRATSGNPVKYLEVLALERAWGFKSPSPHQNHSKEAYQPESLFHFASDGPSMGIVPQLPLEGILVLRYCALVAVLVSLLFPLRAAAPDSGLKGLSALGVVVGNPGAEARRAGLTEVQLRQDV